MRSYSVLARGVGREDGRARAAMTPEGEDEPAKNAAGDLMKGLTNILSIGSLFPEEVRPEDLDEEFLYYLRYMRKTAAYQIMDKTYDVRGQRAAQ